MITSHKTSFMLTWCCCVEAFPRLATQSTTHIFNIKVPDGPVLQWYFRGHCDVDIVKVLGANIPVLLTFNLGNVQNKLKEKGHKEKHDRNNGKYEISVYLSFI